MKGFLRAPLSYDSCPEESRERLSVWRNADAEAGPLTFPPGKCPLRFKPSVNSSPHVTADPLTDLCHFPLRTPWWCKGKLLETPWTRMPGKPRTRFPTCSFPGGRSGSQRPAPRLPELNGKSSHTPLSLEPGHCGLFTSPCGCGY